MLIFGPVPSRRLGRSMGINIIPRKICSYACIYCQAGATTRHQARRSRFYDPILLFKELNKKLTTVKNAGKTIDYLTFVADGEPTLDIRLGEMIDLFKPLGVSMAVISNASTVWQKQVRDDLLKADWVSLKIDAVWEPIWKKVNRPHRSLQLDRILDGVLTFADEYQGSLATESMLVKDINDHPDHMDSLAEFLSQLRPNVSYLSIPIRPPASSQATPPSQESIIRGFQRLQNKLTEVELLIGYEGNNFDFTGDVINDLLSITSVHPMRKDAVQNFLFEAKANWSVVKQLIDQDQLGKTIYQGDEFYMRKPNIDVIPPCKKS
jgi:wyosine [tRNA(Phe)-imidazoG37] synthetase (radical SAM superfamily)